MSELRIARRQLGGGIKDNTGDNISSKNPLYCELTGVYWIWKNYHDAEYVGLCHYRRFLAKTRYSLRDDYAIMREADILALLQGCDIVLAEPIKKIPVLNHYYFNDADYEKDRMYREITSAMRDVCPEYLSDAIEVLKARRMSFSNVLVAHKKIFDQYCEWLFNIETYLETYIEKYEGGVEPREYGFISEWLLNIWVKHNNLRVKYAPLIQIREEAKLKRLLRNIKYKLLDLL